MENWRNFDNEFHEKYLTKYLHWIIWIPRALSWIEINYPLPIPHPLIWYIHTFHTHPRRMFMSLIYIGHIKPYTSQIYQYNA